MKRCVRCGDEKPLAEFTMRSVAADRRESACRECRKIRRREHRSNRRHRDQLGLAEPRGGIYYMKVPCSRLLPLLERWELENPGRLSSLQNGTILRGRHRMLYEQGEVSFDYADRLLIALGMEHEWHGELADLYEGAPADRVVAA